MTRLTVIFCLPTFARKVERPHKKSGILCDKRSKPHIRHHQMLAFSSNQESLEKPKAINAIEASNWNSPFSLCENVARDHNIQALTLSMLVIVHRFILCLSFLPEKSGLTLSTKTKK
ncbi:hypothetical protein N7836_000212 [Vibrio vulnificus]|uniref:hypothetical protein n=1 Tax=Vibrio vulnificus TaxID=672 RepID=UPI0013EE55B9|nr:hypothetical protein [Vibrio vulnificus]EGQ7964167.1 hypothetical protein [Vibrio vulnificus]EJV9310235.1 hypothetical protein [Vibrio vulnificus]